MQENLSRYKTRHTLLLIVQWLFLAVGLLSTGRAIVTEWGHIIEAGMTNGVPYLLNFLQILAVLVYAVYGYKRKPIYYNVCLSLHEFALMARTMQFIANREDTAHLITNRFGTVCSLLCIAALILTFAYANTYKKHKKAALILGAILFIGQLIYSVAGLLVTLQLYPGQPQKIIESQIFVSFFACGAMLISYAVRTHWSLQGKPDFSAE